MNCTPDFGEPRGARSLIRDFLRVAEKILLLRPVKILQWQRGSLDVKNQGGHADGEKPGTETKPGGKACRGDQAFRPGELVMMRKYLSPAFYIFFAATKITTDQLIFWFTALH